MEKFINIAFIIVFLILLFFIVFMTYQKVSMEKRIRDRRVKPRKTNYSTKANPTNTWLNYLGGKLDKDYLELKLIHSSNPLGIKNISQYILFKCLFTVLGIIMGLQLYNKDSIQQSIIFIIITTVVGFFFLDYLIKSETKSRAKKINSQLPIFLLEFDTYNKAGFLFEDILPIVIEVLDGELKKEVIRFNVQYSMTKNFEESLRMFSQRLGINEVDSLEIKLRQCYYDGIYDNLISEEKEMIEKKVLNDMAQESKRFELYLAIAMGLLVLNLFLILIHPLTKMVMANMGGIM